MVRKDYEKLFSRLESSEPPAGLFSKIIIRIREEERLFSVKKRLIFFSTAVLMSAGAFFPAFSAFKQEFAGSGFYQYLSLPFSDLGIVMQNWQDFGLIILESLPAMSIVAFLTTALIFLWSLKYLARDLRAVLNRSRLLINN